MLKKVFPFLIGAVLLIISVVWDASNRSSYSDSSIAKEVSNNLDRELTGLEKEAMLIFLDSSLNWSTLKHSFYEIDQGRIIKWSSNKFAINATELEGDYQVKLWRNPHSDLLLYKFVQGKKAFVGVLPLRAGYEIMNRYLTTIWNEKIFPAQGLKIFPLDNRLGADVCIPKRGCLFKVQIPDGAYFENSVSLGITSFAIGFALWGIYLIVRALHRQRKFFAAFLMLFGALAAIRIAMVEFLFPGRWMYAEFFDPKYFASSSFNASVGDFFLNALIVATASAYLFKIFPRLSFVKYSRESSSAIKSLIAVFLLLASFFSFLFPHLFVESIFHDSAISIDITTSIRFDGLRLVAWGALLLGYISSFFFVHILVRWTKFLVTSSTRFLLYLLVSSSLFIAYFVFSELNYWPTLFLGVIFFLLLYRSKYFRSLSVVGHQAFFFLLIVVLSYAAQGALGIWRFAEEKEVRSMFRSANHLISRDVLGEYLLNETTKKIADDKFILTGLTNPMITATIRQKIRQVYLNSYFDRYEVTINLYGADGKSADIGSSDFAASFLPFENESNKTSYEGIYFIRSAASESVKHYLAVTPVRSDKLAGYVVLDLSSSQIVPQQVYPELLVDNRFSRSIRNKNYSYAFFRQKDLVGSIGSFNFDRDFEIGFLNDHELFSNGIKVNGEWLAGAEDETGKRAIVSCEAYPVFFALANFSYIFILGIGLIFISILGHWIARWRKRMELNYSARIQLYIYLSFILPLIVVSTIALRMISQSDEVLLERETREKGLRITESMADLLHSATGDSIIQLPNKLAEIAKSTLADINVYRPSGELIASSQPTIFSNALVMPLMDRSVWEKIVNRKFNIVQAKSRIGLLKYNSLFFAIKPTGKNGLVGILELPFFQSDSETTGVSVLANILVTFVAVFILFLFLTFTAINRLTSPLRFIAKKLKSTSLENNLPIAWRANDEIGGMVKEYNRMLNTLEQNKIELLRSQRERAWREIAQQVAHEIKNPLTPMKLTLQQLALAMAQEGMDKERTKKSVDVLLAQVEVLNGIASSFNAFATMPAPELKPVEITSLLKNTVLLFENHTQAAIHWKPPAEPIHVIGDELLLGRIFSNIILNGIQSRASSNITVIITMKLEDKWCVIKIEDDGPGISPALLDKIFFPHFTTKQSGSGLGLAIAKQGIEQMGGTIWFETKEGQGSSFYLRLAKI